MDADGNDNTPEWGYCQEQPCSNPAIPCYLPGNSLPDDPDDLLCVEHCTAAGYCWGCGRYSAGLETFDFDSRNLCDECRYDPDLGYEPDYEIERDVWFDPFEEDLSNAE